MNFRQTLDCCKRRIRRIFNGVYIDKNEYLEDFPQDPENIHVDVNKLTQHMKQSFDNKCNGCMNENCDWCKYNSLSCWDELFNPIPNGLMAYLLSTPHKSDIVRNEITDNELKVLITDYKHRTNSDIKAQIKELLSLLKNKNKTI
jgi:hypothetical protein